MGRRGWESVLGKAVRVLSVTYRETLAKTLLSSSLPPQIAAYLLLSSWFWTLGPNPNSDTHAQPSAGLLGAVKSWVLIKDL